MPDFTEEIYWHCASVEDCTVKVVGSSGKTYTVKRGRTRRFQNGWVCECAGYKFRGHCKHGDQANADPSFCNWQQQIDGGDIVRGADRVARCPKCNNIAIAQRYAV